jgi:MFS family permease
MPYTRPVVKNLASAMARVVRCRGAHDDTRGNVAQCVMIPVALWAGRAANTHGRKPVFMLGFCVLPVRGLLYTLSSNPYILVSIQILDGIGAGIFGVLSVLVVADLTRGTGRFNITNGTISTATGIGQPSAMPSAA